MQILRRYFCVWIALFTYFRYFYVENSPLIASFLHGDFNRLGLIGIKTTYPEYYKR